MLGLAVVAGLALALRTATLLDRPVAVDEPLVVERARAVLDGELAAPGVYPPLLGYLVAAVLAVVRAAGGAVEGAAAYPPAQLLAAAVSVVAVVLTGLLAFAAAAGDRRRVTAALVGAGALAVAYVAVRLGGIVKPDHLQAVAMVAAVAAALRHDATGARRWAVAAGAATGLAVAAKYAGGVVALPVAVALLTRPGPARRRVADLAAAAAGGVAAVVAGTLGTAVTHAGQMADVVVGELAHQAEGHLGYEPAGPGWWFHATETLPGSWGWPLTVVALGAVVWLLARGTRRERLVAGTAAVTFAVVGLSAVRFPHYALVALPFLAASAGLVVGRVVARLPRPAGVALLVALAASLVPTVGHDVRLARTFAAPSTRELAAPLAAAAGGPLWAEAYTVTGLAPDVAVGAWGAHPEVLRCRCVVAVSSYQEERFRRRPGAYAPEVAVYDALRARGRVLAVVGPEVTLPYDWDQLPDRGLDRIALTGDIGPVGPVVTLLDLR